MRAGVCASVCLCECICLSVCLCARMYACMHAWIIRLGLHAVFNNASRYLQKKDNINNRISEWVRPSNDKAQSAICQSTCKAISNMRGTIVVSGGGYEYSFSSFAYGYTYSIASHPFLWHCHANVWLFATMKTLSWPFERIRPIDILHGATFVCFAGLDEASGAQSWNLTKTCWDVNGSGEGACYQQLLTERKTNNSNTSRTLNRSPFIKHTNQWD